MLPPANPQIETLVEKGQRGRRQGAEPGLARRVPAELAVDPDQVSVEEARAAGPLHAGHQMGQQLGLSEILSQVGLSGRACQLSEAMTLNRLIFPLSAHALPDCMRRTALPDILGADLAALHDDALYRNLDRLHPNRERIEAGLAEREKTLFNLDDTLYLYDLTSTYFEGQALSNPQAQRGYSRDKRPDCKQVLVGLVLDRDGFPKAQEVFDGNRQDRTTVGKMLDSLEKRRGPKAGSTVVVDLLVAIEKHFLDRGVHTSGWTLRQQLSTHQVITVVLPTKDGSVLKIRKGTTPEPLHREIYTTRKIPPEVMKPVKTWPKLST